MEGEIQFTERTEGKEKAVKIQAKSKNSITIVHSISV
jgi:hypothetical protein